ncbi:DUF6807 family protein [Microcella sp.]|uniref:DUF6807 family protein n=1 Tax=Microcella sp. TaxID=1913979 RepID=UPI003F6E4AFB
MMTSTRSDGNISVVVDGVAIARYVTHPDVPAMQTPKPYVHPLTTRAGHVVTDFAPDDHLWHHGLFFGVPLVADANLWGGWTYFGPERGYELVENQGSIRQRGDAVVEQGADRLSVASTLDWVGQEGEPLLTESRQLEFVAPEATGWWQLSWISTLTNPERDSVSLETPAQGGRPDGGYGGLFFRGAPGLVTNRILGKDGPVDDSGVDSPWLVVHLTANDGSLVTLGCATDQAERSRWIIRGGNFSGFGWAFLYDNGLTLGKGESVQLGHRLVVADGHVSADDIVPLLTRA